MPGSRARSRRTQARGRDERLRGLTSRRRHGSGAAARKLRRTENSSIAGCRLDVLIFGGGGAGLWLLDELTRRGFAVLAVETQALGAGQTVASQGIIHGGLKYTLSGRLTRSAASVRDMPQLWRDCLTGRRPPDLSGTRVLSDSCCLWRTETLKSKLGFAGARAGLRSQVERLPPAQIPEALSGCPGDVFRVDEPVISPPDFLADLARRNANVILKIHPEGVHFTASKRGVRSVALRNPATPSETLAVSPRWVVLTAGAGNAGLRKAAGLEGEAMQLRPLRMVMARGPLPMLWGHCVDGARTRVTVSSQKDSHGRTVWQIGGNVAEAGAAMTERQAIQFAQVELQAVLPGVDFEGVEWAAYRIDRAEGKTVGGRRPESPTVRVEGNVVTAWPTKLALIPALAEAIVNKVGEPEGLETPAVAGDWPRPEVAATPWETCRKWRGTVRS